MIQVLINTNNMQQIFDFRFYANWRYYLISKPVVIISNTPLAAGDDNVILVINLINDNVIKMQSFSIFPKVQGEGGGEGVRWWNHGYRPILFPL